MCNISVGYIDYSSIHGLGLFANTSIKKSSVLGELDGQTVDKVQLPMFRKANRHYGFDEWTAISEDKLLVRPYRTKYGYLNHSREPNIELQGYLIVALRDIKKEDEMLVDYRKEHLGEEYLRSRGQYL